MSHVSPTRLTTAPLVRVKAKFTVKNAVNLALTRPSGAALTVVALLFLGFLGADNGVS